MAATWTFFFLLHFIFVVIFIFWQLMTCFPLECCLLFGLRKFGFCIPHYFHSFIASSLQTFSFFLSVHSLSHTNTFIIMYIHLYMHTWMHFVFSLCVCSEHDVVLYKLNDYSMSDLVRVESPSSSTLQLGWRRLKKAPDGKREWESN